MSYIARAFAAGAVGAFGVVFGKSYYDAFNERQSLNRMEGERKTHEAELSTLAKSISSSKAAIESLEEQSKSAGAEAEAIGAKLSKAREAVAKLEKEHAAKVALLQQAREMREAKANLLSDLSKLHAAKQTKVDSLSLAVSAQKERVAQADELANPLNHPMVKKYFS